MHGNTTTDVLWVHLMQGIFLLKQKITIKMTRALGLDLAGFSLAPLRPYCGRENPLCDLQL